MSNISNYKISRLKFPLIDLISRYLAYFARIICTLYFVIIFTGVSLAREINIRAGNFEINPSFGITQEFNSNFFSEDNSSEEQPDSEETIIYTPRLRIKYPGRNLILEFDYMSDIKRNRYFSISEDTEDQNVFVGVGLISPGQRLKLTLSNQFLETRDPSSIDIRDALINRADRVENIIKAKIDFKLTELFKLVFKVSHENNRFSERAFEEENTQTLFYNSSLFYQFLPKTSATIMYEVESIIYPDSHVIVPSAQTDRRTIGNFNTLAQSIRTGLSFDATAKLSGDVTFGYITKKPTQSTTGTSKIVKSFSEFAFDADLTWKIRERTTLIAEAKRTIDNVITGSGSFITRSGIALGLSQEILDKFTLYLKSIYINSEYNRDNEGNKRNDNLYGLGISLAYDIQQWIEIKLSYQHKNNLSNSKFNENEYRSNEWIFNINALF